MFPLGECIFSHPYMYSMCLSAWFETLWFSKYVIWSCFDRCSVLLWFTWTFEVIWLSFSFQSAFFFFPLNFLKLPFAEELILLVPQNRNMTLMNWIQVIGYKQQTNKMLSAWNWEVMIYQKWLETESALEARPKSQLSIPYRNSCKSSNARY